MPASSPRPDVFRAIADPTRRAILDRLRAGPTPVNALAAEFDQSRPAISKHLRVLREARLVTEERSGRERLYELQPAALQIGGCVDRGLPRLLASQPREPQTPSGERT